MKKRGKKGQITIFILLGIVIAIGIGLFMYLRATSSEIDPNLVPVVNPVRNYVDACMESR